MTAEDERVPFVFRETMYNLTCVAAAALACFSTANAFGLGVGTPAGRVSYASKVSWNGRGSAHDSQRVHTIGSSSSACLHGPNSMHGAEGSAESVVSAQA